MIIYKATNLINNKMYIGKTVQELWARKSHHKHCALKNKRDTIFYRAIKKHGWDNFAWEIIDTANTIEELDEKEKYWISFYGSHGINGYNATDGGEGTVGYNFTDETKNKISQTRLKNLDTYEHIKLNSEIVKEIKILLMSELYTQKEIAEKFNVKRNVINSIKCMVRWAHVYVEGFEEWSKNTSGHSIRIKKQSKLNEEKVKEVKKLLNEKKLTHKEIAKIFNVTVYTIDNIKNGKAWKYITI